MLSSRFLWNDLLLKVVAIPHTCFDLFAITAYFLSQSGDVHIHRTVEHQHILWPAIFQQVFAGIHPAGMLEKERQQFELQFRAYQFLAIEGDGLRVQVERNALIANPVVRRCGRIIGSVNGNVKVLQVPRSW